MHTRTTRTCRCGASPSPSASHVEARISAEILAQRDCPASLCRCSTSTCRVRCYFMHVHTSWRGAVCAWAYHQTIPSMQRHLPRTMSDVCMSLALFTACSHRHLGRAMHGSVAVRNVCGVSQNTCKSCRRSYQRCWSDTPSFGTTVPWSNVVQVPFHAAVRHARGVANWLHSLLGLRQPTGRGHMPVRRWTRRWPLRLCRGWRRSLASSSMPRQWAA